MKNQLSKRSFLFLGAGAFVIILSVTLFALTRGTKKVPHPPEKAVVHDNGERIEFKPNSPGLEIVKASVIGGGGEFVNLEAPARLIASTSPSVSGGSRIILFESAELNDLYVGYVHAKNKVYRSRKNLSRIQDMFKHRVATEKDLVESETDVGNDAAELAEFEGKLRAVGLNPSELATAGNKKAWIISDVPESQISNLKRGKRVTVKFSSFPDEIWEGQAEAIGDNVDPYTRTAKVRIEIINKDYRLKPGMFGVVKFPEETADNTVILPFNSIVTVEGKNYVFVEHEPLNFVRKEVVLGVSTKDVVNIIDGVKQGDRVVIQGSILLKGLSFGF
ncbi:efflux RND transporter periplasmic adaptor subunit [Leptospira idonii]|uniref:efflux RND transporter periplasmic adaptor subunit n=1 Tax=Leptospira idonii TaxID=1193500 RepID=UPI0014383AB6|nr:efflux RND transporter periplasmic adaptor subunit [Leptospira idonii]